jgi:CBS domain containing-hemolysin-like protein
MEIDYQFRWVALGGLLLLYGLFCIAETSLLALTPLDRLRLKEKNPTRGKLVEALLQRSQQLLITLIFGVEIVTIMATVLATSLALTIWGARGELVALLIMSPVMLLLGEIIPKSIALTYPARLAPLVAPVVRLAIVLFTPLRVILVQISRGILATLGFRPDLTVPVVQEEDFVRMVEESHRGGMIAGLEREFIHNLLSFGEARVSQIMVPRLDIFSLPIDMPEEEIFQHIKRARFSRIPVYQDNPGNILGILYAKDLLRVCPGKPCHHEVLRNLLRPPLYVPENKKAFDLLTELQAQHVRLALVVDEYGSLVGLISVEDLLEELFVEISQEFKEEEQLWQEVSPGVWRVSASMSLADFNRLLDLDIPTAELGTVGGLVLNLFGELPREGENFFYKEHNFKVLKMKGTRILEVEVRRRS